jgi:glycosyltransferase involved in cell wall biosynthesis
MKAVLMVAFHYPPCFGSSGIQRTLKLSRYLPDSGWRPIVLSAHPRAYAQTNADQLADIPSAACVTRAFALDTSRHLAIRGASLRVMSLPDRWVSWSLGAIPAGLGLIRRHRPAVLWSTYPIATAHLIALALHRLSGLPWIADFRDSMTEPGYPRDRLSRVAYLAIERRVVAHAARLVFTAPSTRAMYLARYPRLAPERCLIISNGYDESDFTHLVSGPSEPMSPRCVRLIHAGVNYPEERDPVPFFRALAGLKRDGVIEANSFRVELRASGSEDRYRGLLAELGIADLVQLLPALPYRQMLQDCRDADGLLLLQGPSCNHQIPAKLYEYLRLRRPILALTDLAGDTAGVLSETGGATIVDLLDEGAIRQALPGFLEKVRTGGHPIANEAVATRHARHVQAQSLADCFAGLATPRQPSRHADFRSVDRPE